MINRIFLIVILFFGCFTASKVFAQVGGFIYTDSFEKPLDKSVWVAEIEPVAGNSVVYTKNGSLILDTRGGVTVWLNKKLEGRLQIEYDRQVLVDTGKNDRLSDFNQFWMASDPKITTFLPAAGSLKLMMTCNCIM